MFRAYPEIIERYPNLEVVTVPVYARLLKESALANMIMETVALFPDVPLDKICIELSADIKKFRRCLVINRVSPFL